LGCGRCVAACPTRALEIPGFHPYAAFPATGEPIRVECWKVPRAFSFDAALRVPCLGGLTVSCILALSADAGGRPVAFLDRGWCRECSAGRGEAHPLAQALSDARDLLKAAGTADASLPRLQERRLPASLMPGAIPEPSNEQRVSRRGFFRSLAREAVAAVSEATAAGEPGFSQPPLEPGLRVAPVERRKRISVLGVIAERNGKPLPATLFPTAWVEDSCCNHQICAGVCPTGALRAYSRDGATGVRFDPGACIACGACERACPEQAMRVGPVSAPEQPQEERPLTRFAERLCADCETPYADLDGEECCPVCRKSRELACSAFALGTARRATGNAAREGEPSPF
jgi:ferredoxin